MDDKIKLTDGPWFNFFCVPSVIDRENKDIAPLPYTSDQIRAVRYHTVLSLSAFALQEQNTVLGSPHVIKTTTTTIHLKGEIIVIKNITSSRATTADHMFVSRYTEVEDIRKSPHESTPASNDYLHAYLNIDKLEPNTGEWTKKRRVANISRK